MPKRRLLKASRVLRAIRCRPLLIKCSLPVWVMTPQFRLRLKTCQTYSLDSELTTALLKKLISRTTGSGKYMVPGFIFGSYKNNGEVN